MGVFPVKAAGARRARAIWAPSLLRRLLRHRGARVVLLAGSVGLSAMSLQGRLSAAAAERDAWGVSETVALVVAPVGAGQQLDGAVELVERPGAMVPDGAVIELPSGAIAAVDLVVGEVLLRERLVGDGVTSRPAGTVAVTVDIDGDAALVETGDLVDLWSIDVATLTSVRVVAGVVVLGRADEALTVAVPESAMADVAVASLRPLTIAVR